MEVPLTHEICVHEKILSLSPSHYLTLLFGETVFLPNHSSQFKIFRFAVSLAIKALKHRSQPPEAVGSDHLAELIEGREDRPEEGKVSLENIHGWYVDKIFLKFSDQLRYQTDL